MSSLSAMNAVVASRVVLPDDLFEHIILPDLLSQHLHSLLVDSDPPTWHAFYVLPLVSPLFYDICQRLVAKIFGTKIQLDTGYINDDVDSDDEEELHPFDVLKYAISVCKRSRRPASKADHVYHDHSMSTLMKNPSLVQVYTCLALGKIFLNIDVLLPLGAYGDQVSRTPRSPWDEDYEEANQVSNEPSAFEEGNMHRCFMPFECAKRICDIIAPRRLGFVVAEYMAQVLPLYHSLPIFAKSAQDLRLNVARNYKLGLDYYTEWTLQTLGRLEVAEELIHEMVSSGALVRSFGYKQGIPTEALKITRILAALDDVVRADWGAGTNVARKKAGVLILRWTARVVEGDSFVLI